MSVKVSRILHAGYLLECAETVIAFDPIFENPFSKNCFAFPEIKFNLNAIQNLKLDAIFISHYHDDHFSLESLNHLNKNIPIYLYSIFDEFLLILKDLGFKNVYPLENQVPILLGPFEILPLEALDHDTDSIYHIKATGFNILHVVDSWIGPATMNKLLTTSQWDLVLWPFQTMREIEVISPNQAEPVSAETTQLPPEWLEQIEQLSPRALVPSSCQFRFEDWSWYNLAFFPISYAQFEKQINSILPNTLVYKLNPGNSIILENNQIKKGENLVWITPVGNQDIDYEFSPEVTPQTISEISQKFPPLSEYQRKLIKNYCQHTILNRYASLNSTTEESTFLKPQYWQLIVYDHTGLPYKYIYKIHQKKINAASPSVPWTWQTEISESKLVGALMEGESLTSIYIRVTPAPGANPLEDPLIRCLYEGVIGGYQLAQLRKLQRATNS